MLNFNGLLLKFDEMKEKLILKKMMEILRLFKGEFCAAVKVSNIFIKRIHFLQPKKIFLSKLYLAILKPHMLPYRLPLFIDLRLYSDLYTFTHLRRDKKSSCQSFE